MKTKMGISLFLFCTGLCFFLTAAHAEVPGLIIHQGYLTDPDGVPINGEVELWFKIYDQEVDGNDVWSEEPRSYTVTGGVFQAVLGQITPLTPAHLTGPRWLEVKVNGEHLEPRERIVSCFFAIEAGDADTVDGAHAAALEESAEIDADLTSHTALAGAHHSKTTSFLELTDSAMDVQIPDDITINYAAAAGNADTVDGYHYAAFEETAEIDADIASHTAIAAAHHTKTTSFSELTDTATDAQIPNTITINYAAMAGDADTVDGAHAAALEESTEILAQIAAHSDIPDAHHIKTTSFSELTDTATDAQIPNDITINYAATAGDSDRVDGQHASAFAPVVHDHDDRYYLKSYIDALEARIDALEGLLFNVTRDGDDIYFNGINVYITNNTGSTEGPVNGLGNLIVGYNETRGYGDDRSGSHNLVVGRHHNYSSYGGRVGGYKNEVSAPYASVNGGQYNVASGNRASIGGGHFNTSSGFGASVSGGANNLASGDYAKVSGGQNNIASGDWSFIGGGGDSNETYGNNAVGDYSAVLGGIDNIAGDPGLSDHDIGVGSTVCGGDTNTASGEASSVSGGKDNEANDRYTSVSGGYMNTATNYYASVSGGSFNTASGSQGSVSGGRDNEASGTYASVNGGRHNVASGDWSFVGGGGGGSSDGNEAFGLYTAILGGEANIAGDPDLISEILIQKATVCGGSDNTTPVELSTAVGDAGIVYVDTTVVH